MGKHLGEGAEGRAGRLEAPDTGSTRGTPYGGGDGEALTNKDEPGDGVLSSSAAPGARLRCQGLLMPLIPFYR